MKALGDWAFTAGVNRIVFHRSQHQAGLQARPGMTMGPYGVHWERTQTWWDLVPAYHAYLSRCQFLLRQGLPVADVCFLVAEGAPHVFRPPASALRGDPPGPAGAAFDGCPPETLARGRVGQGRPDRLSGRHELSRARAPGAGDDDARAPYEGPRPRRRRRDRHRAASAQVSVTRRLSRLRHGDRAAGRRGLGRLRRIESHGACVRPGPRCLDEAVERALKRYRRRRRDDGRGRPSDKGLGDPPAVRPRDLVRRRPAAQRPRAVRRFRRCHPRARQDGGRPRLLLGCSPALDPPESRRGRRSTLWPIPNRGPSMRPRSSG